MRISCVLYGKNCMSVHTVLQYIVDRHRNGREARIKEMASELQMTKKECLSSIQMANEEIKDIGIEIVPGCIERVDGKGDTVSRDSITLDYTHVVRSYDRCDFVHMRKTLECSKEENKTVNKYVHEIAYIAMIVLLNGMDMEYTRVVDGLKKINRTECVLKKAVADKYMKKHKKGEIEYIRIGWRFCVEYPCFSPEHYIECVQREVEQANEEE